MNRAWTSIVVLLLLVLAPGAVGAQPGTDPQYLEAKRLFDSLDYDSAVRALDLAISGLQARAPEDPVRRSLLASAYEMRGRAKFGLGDQDGAKADFLALLKVNPGYMFPAVSPRVTAMFDAAAKEVVTTLNLSVTPPTAKAELDRIPVTPGNGLAIAVGEHVLTVERPGYRKVQQTVVAETGKVTEAAVVLERVSSLLSILTSPPDVDVSVDGVKRGKIGAGPPAAEYADAVAKAAVPAAQVSAAMVISDLQPGSHLIELSRDCYVRAQRRLTIEQPDDYTVGPVVLDKAVAALVVQANDAQAQLFVDGQGRGGAPFSGMELCEGEHAVELRSPTGRYFKRVQARSGDRVSIEAIIKPALALVSVFGQPATGPDLRLVVERAFEGLRGTTLFAPPAEQADQALKASQLPSAWLALDGNRRPVDSAADVVAPVRREASSKLAAAFSSQGVASVTVVGRNRVVISMLAAGSGQPDVVEVSLDNQSSIAEAMAQLDRMPSLQHPSIGLVAVDIADVTGAVVTNVDANGPAGKAGIAVGSIITKANGQPVADAGALAGVLSARKADEDLSLEIKDRSGAVKTASVKVAMTPMLVGVADQTLPANRILLALRARLAGQAAPADETVVRLNLAAALARLEAWSDARAELQKVKLPDGSGVANGTVQYLLGLCAEKLGDRAGAEAALTAAAASDSLLTENGPPVKDLAQARLAELRRPGAR